jgi:hypothetical protein
MDPEEWMEKRRGTPEGAKSVMLYGIQAVDTSVEILFNLDDDDGSPWVFIRLSREQVGWLANELHRYAMEARGQQ